MLTQEPTANRRPRDSQMAMASRPTSPAEPTKKYPPPVQSNAHPYAIKTTSSALLSRSNSSPHSTNYTRHHYIPSAPTRVTTGTRVRHRHSSSLSSVEGVGDDGRRTVPAPLPTPPPIIAATLDNPSGSAKDPDSDEPKLTHRLRRAETMPSEFVIEKHNHDQKHTDSHGQESTPELCFGLPPNPKQWSTDEVTNYLETSLRSGDGDADKDDSSLMGVLECVRTRGLTGRELLRLTDADLASMPLSDVQRIQLLERSRTLRVDVLRGRIYVDSYHSHSISDDSNEIYSQPARSSTPFRSVHGASVSVDDLRLHLESNSVEGAAAFPPSPAMTLHRSNSVSDASAQRYRDLARLRVRRRGRVKGLVETWERTSTSGSECSASEEGSVSGGEAESESETDPELEYFTDAGGSPEPSSDLPCVVHDEPHRDVPFPTADSSVVQEPPFSTPPPPYTRAPTTLGTVEDETEEPSIEELLASSSSIPLIGARAWEADIGLGETVKRIRVSESAGAEPLAMEPEPSDHPKDGCQQTQSNPVRSKRPGLRGSARNSGKNAKSEKRVVTAIFTGSLAANVGDEVHLVDHHHQASDTLDIARGDILADSNLQNDSDSALRALEESIAATRAQVDAFRLRLEQLEADTARQEAESKRAPHSDAPHSSKFELRRRRSEANSRVMAGAVGLSGEETVVEDVETSGTVGTWKTMPLGDIARSLVARAVGWLFRYGHLGAHARKNQDRSPAYNGGGPGVNARNALAEKKGWCLPVARMSCSIVLVSCAVCVAVLRRMGFGRWARRP